MAPSSDPNVLANNACPYNRCIPPGMQLSVMISELALLLQNTYPDIDVTPNTLLNSARCYNCEIPPGDQMGVAIYLLDQLSGSGVGSVRHGSGVPVGDSPGTPTTQYTNDDTGLQYTLSAPGLWI